MRASCRSVALGVQVLLRGKLLGFNSHEATLRLSVPGVCHQHGEGPSNGFIQVSISSRFSTHGYHNPPSVTSTTTPCPADPDIRHTSVHHQTFSGVAKHALCLNTVVTTSCNSKLGSLRQVSRRPAFAHRLASGASPHGSPPLPERHWDAIAGTRDAIGQE
ncbi:hypothetical protein B0I37DRAFT_349934 [Chaetomium sp. MPI-CAGE-AT-0009]|nr:hypothetical protein B0I37DRAFT_349934 [Chaetomium sp. MPI-CAGE-AT-0009]